MIFHLGCFLQASHLACQESELCYQHYRNRLGQWSIGMLSVFFFQLVWQLEKKTKKEEKEAASIDNQFKLVVVFEKVGCLYRIDSASSYIFLPNCCNYCKNNLSEEKSESETNKKRNERKRKKERKKHKYIITWRKKVSSGFEFVNSTLECPFLEVQFSSVQTPDSSTRLGSSQAARRSVMDHFGFSPSVGRSNGICNIYEANNILQVLLHLQEPVVYLFTQKRLPFHGTITHTHTPVLPFKMSPSLRRLFH